MATRHIVTALKPDHELVLKEMNSPPDGKILHRLKLPEEELAFPTKAALTLLDQITNLPLRVGNEVIVITDIDQALIELLTVCFLQRRFNECIKVSVRRSSGEFYIPYITSLTERSDEKEGGMVNYNYSSGSCGGCSGNCSSC